MTIQTPNGEIIQTNNLKHYKYKYGLSNRSNSYMFKLGHVILDDIRIKDLPNKHQIPKFPFIITENFYVRP